MTINPQPDPEDVANMLANLNFDCKLGYQEIVQTQNAKQAIKRWPLFNQILVENEKNKPVLGRETSLPKEALIK
jgi:hypothetical protein